jgi:hypothetical protein
LALYAKQFSFPVAYYSAADGSAHIHASEGRSAFLSRGTDRDRPIVRGLLLAPMVIAFERVKRTENHIDLAPAERTPWEETYAASEFLVTSHSIPIWRSTDMKTS